MYSYRYRISTYAGIDIQRCPGSGTWSTGARLDHSKDNLAIRAESCCHGRLTHEDSPGVEFPGLPLSRGKSPPNNKNRLGSSPRISRFLLCEMGVVLLLLLLPVGAGNKHAIKTGVAIADGNPPKPRMKTVQCDTLGVLEGACLSCCTDCYSSAATSSRYHLQLTTSGSRHTCHDLISAAAAAAAAAADAVITCCYAGYQQP